MELAIAELSRTAAIYEENAVYAETPEPDLARARELRDAIKVLSAHTADYLSERADAQFAVECARAATDQEC